MKKYAMTIMMFSMILGLSGCDLMGWYECSSLSGWCEPRKPAAVDFWEIKGEKPPRLEDFENHLPNGTTSVDDGAWRSARADYVSRKIDVFESCGLQWNINDSRPLVESFGQEGFDCLERNGLYRNSLSEDVRW